MPTLYYKPGACSLASHVVLEWIGEPYKAIEADLGSEGFRAINPAGAVPALRRDDGSVLTQSSAVLRHLASTHPEAGLARADEAELDRWSAFLTGDLHPAFFPVFVPDRYTVSTDEADLADVRAAGLKLVAAKLRLLDDRLSSSSWLAGDERTYVDAYALPMLRWASSALPDGLAGYPNAERLLGLLLEDAGVIAAMTKENLL